MMWISVLFDGDFADYPRHTENFFCHSTSQSLWCSALNEVCATFVSDEWILLSGCVHSARERERHIERHPGRQTQVNAQL